MIKQARLLVVSSSLLAVGWASPASAQQVDALQARIEALTAQVELLRRELAQVRANPVLALGPYVAVEPHTRNGLAGPHVIFHRANVHIVSGSGKTVDTTGLGNLVIGYNEDSNPAATGSNTAPTIDALRTGSHNLVIGPQNMFTASGGLVAGTLNLVGSNFATVTGGECNGAGKANALLPNCFPTNAPADGATVSGGFGNTASGQFSSVSDGAQNTATGAYSSVSGGYGNLASGNYASVSGGECNGAGPLTVPFPCTPTTGTSDGASVSGGVFNIASGPQSSVSGGNRNIASGFYASVSGGASNIAAGAQSTVSGGFFNSAIGQDSSIGGGLSQTAGINENIN